MPSALEFILSFIAAFFAALTFAKTYKKYRTDDYRENFELLSKIREELERGKPSRILLESAFLAILKGHPVSLEEMACIMKTNDPIKAIEYFSNGARHLTYCASKKKFFIKKWFWNKAKYSFLVIFIEVIAIVFSILFADKVNFDCSFIVFSALFFAAYYCFDEYLIIKNAENFLKTQNEICCEYYP